MTNYTIQFTKKDSLNDKVIIPYGTDLTNYNKTTFRQSIIDHTYINSPFNTLKETIRSSKKYSTTMKTLVGNDIFPKTSNTMLTVYYTSYIKTNIPQTTDYKYKELVRYYSTDDTYPAIIIAAVNSTYYPSSQLWIEIINPNNTLYHNYMATPTAPKIVIDLTADLANARPGEKIVSAQFTSTNFGGDLNDYYQPCVNILSNIFISYTYDE
jgi:hypothetical protein